MMSACIAHRGPDSHGSWVDEEEGFALAHRRLSIVDISAAGHQPMLSSSGRYVLAYNGEIYNHIDLRNKLTTTSEAPNWMGHSDTETLLACIEAWGLERTLQASVGMFAFALWDRHERSLVLARDRMGEKPLYYGWQGNTFILSSELKALKAHPAFNAEIDRGALTLLLRHNYIPAPYSIYQGIYKLPPGTLLRLGIGQRDAEPETYWSLTSIAEFGMAHSFEGSEEEAIDTLELLLGNSIRRQMVADVPLGALLSGGVDSSLITALMQMQSDRTVRTFTIGFDEKAYDEAAHARAVAAHLGTQHTELRLSASDAIGFIPQLPSMYDEPFADSSQLPTYLVMKLARQHVKVALSGDAGDELFGGYNRYLFLPKIWATLGHWPKSLRKNSLALAGLAPSILGRSLGTNHIGNKIEKVRRIFRGSPNTIDDLFVTLISEWENPASIVIDGYIPKNIIDARERWPNINDPVARMMALDSITYLPDDVLVKVDRAAMAVSLETRAPFLDRDVMEFSWTLPMHMKIRDGKGKWILRQLLNRHLPRALFERPKTGFSIPLDEWLRGPLREWASDLLSEDRLRRDGLLRPDAITRTWEAHLKGRGSFGYRLWSVLMFQAWIAEQS